VPLSFLLFNTFWILGMIDINTKEVCMAICLNNQQDAQNLNDLISEHMQLTSVIHTNAWRGYSGLLASRFANHLTVNHSLYFFNHITHVHMNNIESHWQSLRHRLSQEGIRQKSNGFSHFKVFVAPELWESWSRSF
jgi:hypothetical protein